MKSKMKQPEEAIQEEEKEEEKPEVADNAEKTDEESELEALRRENEELQRELAERKQAGERLEGEISEFSEMFPEVSLAEIPDSVWNEVKKGLPLTAAYARHEKKRANSEKRTAEINNAAAERSSGSVYGRTDHYYTADEVRKMSASEVKKNYSHIISSMKHWN